MNKQLNGENALNWCHMAALVRLCCNISFIHNVIYPTNAVQIAFATNAHLISSSHAGTLLYQHRKTENNLNPGKKSEFQAWSWRCIRAHSSALMVLINASTPNLSLSLNSTVELEGLHFSFMLSTKEKKNKKAIQLSYLENEVF